MNYRSATTSKYFPVRHLPKIDSNSDSRRILKTYEYINNHYKDPIRLEELANVVGMSPVSFSRFFKLRSGKTISTYIIDIRLGHATRMLVDTTNSIH